MTALISCSAACVAAEESPDAGAVPADCGPLLQSAGQRIDDVARELSGPCVIDVDCVERSPTLRCGEHRWLMCNVALPTGQIAELDSRISAFADDLCAACGDHFPNEVQDCFEREPDGRAWCVNGTCETNAPSNESP